MVILHNLKHYSCMYVQNVCIPIHIGAVSGVINVLLFLTYPWCGTLINYFTLQYFNGKENIHFVLTVVHASHNDKCQNIDFFDKAL